MQSELIEEEASNEDREVLVFENLAVGWRNKPRILDSRVRWTNEVLPLSKSLPVRDSPPVHRRQRQDRSINRGSHAPGRRNVVGPDPQYLPVFGSAQEVSTFAGKDFTASERKALLKALRLLDEDERHPSLRVHQLRGDREGSWSASASGVLRLTFERLPEGRKRMLTCSKHYDR